MRTKDAILNSLGYRVMKLDELTKLMNAAGSDKGLGMLGRHYYTRIYRDLFAELRDRPITFVEIGLLRPDRDKRRPSNASESGKNMPQLRGPQSAPSLQAWRRYLPNAKIIGFDIDDFRDIRMPGVTILQGDMSNPQDLAQIVKAAGGSIDVIIDDGSHVSHHQQIAFANLFPHVVPGGIYIVEDCHWQDSSCEQADAMKTRDMFAGFCYEGKLRSRSIDPHTAELLASQIESISMHDSLEVGNADTADALCVVRKRKG